MEKWQLPHDSFISIMRLYQHIFCDLSKTLSDRKLEVFTYTSDGMPPRKISEIIQISAKTVDNYRENIKHKLGLKSAAELT